MQYCVPTCSNTPDRASTADGMVRLDAITFHGLPSEECLRAAWLRSLGKQDTQLPDSAAVCMQHVIDDIYETENGFREIETGAIPSIVQVCMLCLDTDSRLFLMSKHKLEQAYEQLTGYSMFQSCDQGNLRQTLCAHCAQRLMNFSRFRDQTLKARSLMLDLVEKHKIITLQHIQSVKHTDYRPKINLISTILGPDHFDFHVEHPDVDTPTEFEKAVEVKKEVYYDTVMGDEGIKLLNEDGKQVHNNNDELIGTIEKEEMDKNLCESATFGCTLCFEEFKHEHEYNEHASGNFQSGGGEVQCETSKPCTAASSRCAASNSSELKYAVQNSDDVSHTSAELAHISAGGLAELKDNKIEMFSTAKTDTIIKRELVHSIKDGDNKSDTSFKTNINIKDDFKGLKKSPIYISSCDSRCEIPVIRSTCVTRNTVQNAMNLQLNNSQGSLRPRTEAQVYICAVCNKTFISKNSLSKHINNHNRLKRYSCKYCPYISKFKHHADMHMQTHTGEKPYSCDLCEYKCARSNNLARHMRTHTTKKISYCKLCDYKSDRNSDLALQMLTHTGKMPYSCNICEYKSTNNNSLVMHMRTHTGEKPYSCKICDYKFSQNSHLHRHMLTHSGETPYSCNLCEYKCAYNINLLKHKRTHSRDKNYFCNVCDYKCAKNSHLVLHMRTHTGEKPYSCEVCEYKFARNSHLRRHMITHSGETPYSCKWCDYKCAQKCYLVSHMRTHTGEKPYSCKLCKYKCAHNTALIKHMKTHCGEMTESCNLPQNSETP